VGVGELDKEKLTPLLRLKYQNSITDALADLGNPEEISSVFVDFQLQEIAVRRNVLQQDRVLIVQLFDDLRGLHCPTPGHVIKLDHQALFSFSPATSRDRSTAYSPIREREAPSTLHRRFYSQ
jgi:hypothetical protein